MNMWENKLLFSPSVSSGSEVLKVENLCFIDN